MKRKVIGIFLTWIGLAFVLISFSPNMTGFAISNSFVFRGGYFLFIGMILAVVGIFMATLEENLSRFRRTESKASELSDAPLYHDSLVLDDYVKQIHDEKYETLVFLDKSVRDGGISIKKRWERNYPGEKCPEIRFVNIGGEKTAPGAKYHPEELKRFRKKDFEHKKILVLDEYVSGGALRLTKDLLEKTFNTSQIDIVDFFNFFGGGVKKFRGAKMGYIITDSDGLSDRDNPDKNHFFTKRNSGEEYKIGLANHRELSKYASMSSEEILEKIKQGKYKPLLKDR